MGTMRSLPLCCAAGALITALLWAPAARAEWNYRNGFGFESSDFELRFNLYAQPRYQFLSEGSEGLRLNTFALELIGARMRMSVPRRRISIQASGGMARDQGVLLDSFLELGLGDFLRLRIGYFRVPYDEQTTHSPFWLRMTGRSIDVRALGQGYDLGLALSGSHLDDALVWSLSMSNGGGPIWDNSNIELSSWAQRSELGGLPDLENSNIDFLYALRVAMRFGDLMGWSRRNDLIIGLGTSWTLEPWEPEPEVVVNRSVLGATLDATARIGFLHMSLAGLYRWIEPGVYGSDQNGLGWHLEVGVMLGDAVELASRLAHLVADLDQRDRQHLEVGVIINGFADQGRLRPQLEYTYLASYEGDGRAFDTHRVVLQLQAYY